MYSLISVQLRVRAICLLAICTLLLVRPSQPGLAQSETKQTSKSSLCTRENALDTIRQQIDLTKTFDNTPRRIAVLIRAADLLWSLQPDKARTTFSEAFELAVQHEKQKLEQSKGMQSSLLLMETPDQRFVVISAAAKRDSVLAKRLLAQIVKDDLRTPSQRTAPDPVNDLLTGERLLTAATEMVQLDPATALEFARTSLRYPANFLLARFLYVLAARNQPAADSFYEQALVAYGNRPMREFLYLTTYPFAFRSSGDTPVFGFYNDIVPTNFKPSNSLQRKFVQMLLRRSQQALEVPLDPDDNFNNFPGLAHVAQTLLRIEPEVSAVLPDLLPELIQTRERILVSLPLETQGQLRPPESTASAGPAKSFAERIEEAEKIGNSDKRYQLIISTILGVSSKEDLDVVLRAIEKVDDAQIRALLKDWLYFNRAQSAIKDNRLEDAQTLAGRIEMLEPRAYLRTEIARALLKAEETQSLVREILEQAISEVNKGPRSIFAARTLLTAANIYLKMDLNRAIALLTMAIETVNQLEAPQFESNDAGLIKEIRRKDFRRVVRFYIPGLDPENALREFAKVDFDLALSQASTFTDKFQRAMTTLSVVEGCMQLRHLSPVGQQPR